MTDQSDPLTSARRIRDGIVRMFIKGVLGLVLVFVIAAIAAPWLFDRRDTLMTALAFGLWLLCPLIVFLTGYEVFAEWTRTDREPRP